MLHSRAVGGAALPPALVARKLAHGSPPGVGSHDPVLHGAGLFAPGQRLLDRGQGQFFAEGVVDAPLGKGHVVMFSINPVWRGETQGTYSLVLNTVMNFDSLNAGRKDAEK